MADRTFVTALLVVTAALLLAAAPSRAGTLAAFLRSSADLTTQVAGPIGDEAVNRGHVPDLGRMASDGANVYLVERTASRVYSRAITRTPDGNIVTGPPKYIVKEVGKYCDGGDCFTWLTGFGGDGGPALSAKLASPQALALDGRLLFVADTGNCRIRRINLDTGIITTIAGNGDCTARTAPNQQWDSAAFAGTAVPLSYPQDIAVDGLGGLYITDTGNRRVRKLDIATGKVTTLAGPGPANPALDFFGDGPAPGAVLLKPVAIAVHVVNANCFPWACNTQYTVVFIADEEAHVVRRFNSSSGNVYTVAGKWRTAAVEDALAYDTPVQARGALLRGPRGITVDPRDGSSVWIADYAHVHVLSGLFTKPNLVTVTNNKRNLPPTTGFGVPLSTFYADRFRHVFLYSDEVYSGPGAHSLWMVTAVISGGASGNYYWTFDLAVSTVNLDAYVLGRKTPPMLLDSTHPL